MPSSREPTEASTFKETAENLNVHENVQGSLTAVVLAAAEAIVEHWTPLDGEPDLTVEDVADEARAVVAAVRDIIAADALRAEAENLERAVPSEDAMPTMFVVPAHIWLRDRAEIHDRAAALRSTEKGTNQ